MAAKLGPGDVILVGFPAHFPPGREQEGLRPAVVVGVPEEPVRFPVVLVAPLTTQRGAWAQTNPTVYPFLPAGIGGLSKPSTILLDQLRSIDLSRVGGHIGRLVGEEYAVVTRGLRKLLGLP